MEGVHDGRVSSSDCTVRDNIRCRTDSGDSTFKSKNGTGATKGATVRNDGALVLYCTVKGRTLNNYSSHDSR